MDEKCRTETCITTYGYVFIQTISGRAVLCATFFIQAMSGLSSVRHLYSNLKRPKVLYVKTKMLHIMTEQR